MNYNYCLTIVVILISLGLASPAYAVPIEAITIEGNKRIESNTIRSYLMIKEGMEFDAEALNSSIKALYATGLFADIFFEGEVGKLTIIVDENPIINQVVFEGNKRIEDQDLLAEVQLKPRTVYTKARLQQDLKRILEIYRKSGRFAVEVNPQIIQLEQGRIDLIFEIKEGPKTTIKQIHFVGNKAFSDKKLTRVIETEKAVWYRFFSGTDSYDADRIAYDKELLRKFYVARGYADFKVTSALAELTEDRSGFVLNFAVEEGEQYHFGDINVSSDLAQFDTDSLQPHIVTKKGEVFNADQVEKTINAIIDQVGEKGYAFVRVDPIFDRNPATKLMGVTYKIEEGDKVYINKIHIDGNVRTLDKVIRREFRLAEGDPYNAAKLRRSQQRIRNLGFFDKVDIQKRPLEYPDKVDIHTKIEERSTGELNFGAGFSSTDGVLANASIRERNLLGQGKDLRLSVQRATKGAEVDLSFTEPYFLGKELSAGIDLFNLTRDRRSESSFDSEMRGGGLRLGYAISEHLRHTLKYSLRQDEIKDVPDTASLFIREQEGSNTVSLIGHSLIYDKRDSRFEPSDGYYVRFNQDLAGLGGDSQYLLNELRMAYYEPIWGEDVILRLAFAAGYSAEFGSHELRINERFFIGGQDIRGFRNAGIGPRDAVSGDALGGKYYFTSGVEFGFPLGLPEELGFSGAAFLDVATLSGIDETASTVLDEDSIRLSLGLGVGWTSPLGPIRLDFGWPLMKEDFDKTQNIRFNFGTKF